MNILISFVVGGLICAIVQIFVDRTKLMPGRIMVGLVIIGAILGFFKIYDKFVDIAGAGATVPLTGFGNVLFNGVKEAIDKDGFIGVFSGGLTASSVGIACALIFSFLISLVCKPKIKK